MRQWNHTVTATLGRSAVTTDYTAMHVGPLIRPGIFLTLTSISGVRGNFSRDTSKWKHSIFAFFYLFKPGNEVTSSNSLQTFRTKLKSHLFLAPFHSLFWLQILECLKVTEVLRHFSLYIFTGWAVAQTCCISQCAKYRKSGIFGYPWEQNPWTDRHETWGA